MKKIRRITFINFIGRIILKYFLSIRELQARWPVAGKFCFRLNNSTQIRFYGNCDDNIANELYYKPKRYIEFEELLFFSEVIKSCRTFFDIGANTGVYTAVAASVSPGIQIHAFEPYPVNAARLKINSELNNASIIINQVALSDLDQELVMAFPVADTICDVISADGDFTRNFYSSTHTYIDTTVKGMRLDSYVKHLPECDIDFIKIDVEGYEIPVIEGARNLLAASKPVIMCEMFVSQRIAIFYQTVLKPLGYNVFFLGEKSLHRLSNLTANPGSHNLVFVANEFSADHISYKEIASYIASRRRVMDSN